MNTVTIRRATVLLWFLVSTCVWFVSRASSADPDWWDAGNMRGFRKNIPDFYQHQYWGDIALWEKDGGWCRPTALLNCLYSWKVQGYNGLLDDDITKKNDWLLQSCIEIAGLLPVHGEQKVNDMLKDRGHGSDKGPGVGLVFNQYTVDQTTGMVTYKSSEKDPITGRSVEKNRMVSAFDAYKNELKDGQDVMIRWSAEKRQVGGMDLMYDPALWWTFSGQDSMGRPEYKGGSYADGNYHYVTGVGVDCKTMEIFFADPDSNKGSGAGDAGIDWTKRPDPAVNGRKYKLPDDMNVPIPERPADMTKDPIDFEKFYGSAKIGADGFTVTDGRYKDIRIGAIETICPIKAAVQSSATTPEGKVTTTMSINPGIYNEIESIILYPNVPVDFSDLGAFSMISSGDVWLTSLLSPSLPDPDGNSRLLGGVRFDLDISLSDGFGPGDLGTAMLNTLSFFDGYDIMMLIAGTSDWLVQTVGADEILYGPQIYYVPEPGSWLLLIGAALPIIVKGRRGKLARPTLLV